MRFYNCIGIEACCAIRKSGNKSMSRVARECCANIVEAFYARGGILRRIYSTFFRSWCQQKANCASCIIRCCNPRPRALLHSRIRTYRCIYASEISYVNARVGKFLLLPRTEFIPVTQFRLRASLFRSISLKNERFRKGCRNAALALLKLPWDGSWLAWKCKSFWILLGIGFLIWLRTNEEHDTRFS